MSAAARQLAGRHALVTGAGSGIGARHRACAGRGRRMRVAGRAARARRSKQVAKHASARRRPRSLDGFDVTDPAAIARRACRSATASSARSTSWSTMPARRRARRSRRPTLELWQRVLAVNLTGVFLVTQRRCLPRPQGAWRRCARSSTSPRTAGLTGYAYVSAYCAAKHGVDRPDAGAGARTGEDRRHRQRRLPRLHRHAAACAGALETIRRKTGRSASEARASLAPVPIRKAGW